MGILHLGLSSGCPCLQQPVLSFTTVLHKLLQPRKCSCYFSVPRPASFPGSTVIQIWLLQECWVVSNNAFCVRHQQTGKSSHLWPRSQSQLAASPAPCFSRTGSSNLTWSLTFGVCSRDFLNTLHEKQEQARNPCITEGDRPASVCPVYGPITLTGGSW